MGTWNTAINGNDTFLDIYSNFFELYNLGQDPVSISKQIVEMFRDDFEDSDTKNDALFGLALAQWETKSQDELILDEVKRIILAGLDLETWKNLGADAKLLGKRKAVLNTFLEKISQPKNKAKRRIKLKVEYKSIDLVNITAPDSLKTFNVSEQYTNGEYIHTGSNLQWSTGGGSVLYFTGLGKGISARWIDSQTLEVSHDKDIVFTKKDDKAYYCGDEVKVTYIAQ